MASVYTETDSGRSFPRIADFDPTNLYVEGNGGFTFPLFFTSQNLLPMTDYSYMFCTLKLRQVISRTSWHWLPYTLELVPGASVGINCITQIIGADYSTFYDTSIGGGFAHYGTAYIGIRTYPAGIFHRNKFNDYAKEDEKIRQRKLEEKMDKMEIKPDDWEGFVPPEKPDSLKQIEDPHSEETASELTPADRIKDVAKEPLHQVFSQTLLQMQMDTMISKSLHQPYITFLKNLRAGKFKFSTLTRTRSEHSAAKTLHQRL